MSITRTIVILIAFISIQSCNENRIEPTQDNFDRVQILENWIDKLIVPGYDYYLESLEKLDLSHKEFQLNKDQPSLYVLQKSFIDAYKSWQSVSMFEIGEAERINLRNNTNLYPCDTSLIINHLEKGQYNLSLPSTLTAQGFPALDFLLFSNNGAEKQITSLTSSNYEDYITALISKLVDSALSVKDTWSSEYRSEFLSDRTSLDRFVNDFLFYYEKFLRAGKVGIPAGVFSGSPLSQNVEAYYSDIYSRDLLLEAIQSVTDFFSGNSLESYLSFLGKEEISDEILALWKEAKDKIEKLNPSLRLQVEVDNKKMLEVYDILQKVVILLKVDMLQTLNIQVDYVDADGD